ncbi:MAG: AtpZ/AtpI family protein [Pseudomonadota bacterium]
MAQAQDGDDAGDADPPSLEALSKRIDAARGAHAPKPQAGAGVEMGRGMKVASELLAAFLVGGGLGWGFDAVFGTFPWAALIGTGFGFAAGVLNAMRAMDEQDREASVDAETDDKRRDDA